MIGNRKHLPWLLLLLSGCAAVPKPQRMEIVAPAGVLSVTPQTGVQFYLYRYADGSRRVTVQVPGDLNCDGCIDFDDIKPMVKALVGESTYYVAWPACEWHNGDCNGDEAVNFDDINPFVTLLVGASGGQP